MAPVGEVFTAVVCNVESASSKPKIEKAEARNIVNISGMKYTTESGFVVAAKAIDLNK